ncbi:MAG: ATP-binding protein [Fimbriiglobus sp.]|nr:ATP-binding protein [Fimbriiglobus sp.]
MFTRVLDRVAPRPGGPIELAAESVVAAIRWFGLVVGVLVAHFNGTAHPVPLTILLLVGLAYTAADTAFSVVGRVFLRDWPAVVATLEVLFIGLLCYFEHGLDSPFRFYYLLAILCGAFRHPVTVTLLTCVLAVLSYGSLLFFVPVGPRDWTTLLFTLVVLLWVTAAAVALGRVLRRAAADLALLNAELTANKEQLETRIAERTRELEESQAQVLHQEKMAAFGLLAAGIAHEVGNPLAGISGVVQMLDRRDLDPYTREKLALVNSQLARIQIILRELVTFSRPASDVRGKVSVREVVDEALGIAKYYRGGKNRQIIADVPPDLPPLVGVRDQFVQVLFNLVLNAIDATDKGGTIRVAAEAAGECLRLSVTDDGMGIPAEVLPRLFRPYFTTKKHGTGLGLFVLRRIVVAHGGSVAIESEVGKGTTFRVELPVEVEHRRLPTEAQRHREGQEELTSSH